MDQLLLTGKFVNTHGVRGVLKALYYTDSPDYFKNVAEIVLKNGRSYRLAGFSVSKGCVLLTLEGIGSVEEAAPLVGQDFYTQRQALEAGRFYVADLLGLLVKDEAGKSYGRVTDVFSTGSNDVYEVDKKYYIPAIRDVVLKIDPDGGEMIIFPMEGLFDDEN